MKRNVAAVFPKLNLTLMQKLTNTPLRGIAVLLVLGLSVFLMSNFDDATSAQTGGLDRTQYVNDTPVGDLPGPDTLPETGEVNVMIELFDLPTGRVYAEALGHRSDRAVSAQQRAAARGA